MVMNAGGVSRRNGKRNAHRVGPYMGRQLDGGGLAHGPKRGSVAAYMGRTMSSTAEDGGAVRDWSVKKKQVRHTGERGSSSSEHGQRSG
jgi:hypothetical protein